MHPLILVLLIALGLLAFILILSLIVGVAMVASSKAIVKKLDSQNTESVHGLLPGDNCGECGYPDCRAYARALCFREAEPTACPKCSEEVIASVNALIHKFETPEKLPSSLRERKHFLRSKSEDQKNNRS